MPFLTVLVLQKDKEDLEEVSNEIELCDEDETVQYVSSKLAHPQVISLTDIPSIGLDTKSAIPSSLFHYLRHKSFLKPRRRRSMKMSQHWSRS